MAKIYGEIDSLEHLLSILEATGAKSFSSLDEITLFKQNYDLEMNKFDNEVRNELKSEIAKKQSEVLTLNNEYNKKITEREKLLVKEIKALSNKIKEFNKKPNNIISNLYYFIKLHFLNKRKNYLNKNFEAEKQQPFKALKNQINLEIKNIDYLEKIPELDFRNRVAAKAKMLIQTKKVLDENKPLFFGAIGEQKAVNELKKLSDAFTVINGLKLEFNPPIYNRNTDQRIYSIQADHIVVGPSGIFLIETKNWSQDSIHKIDLYSPVEQVRRSNFALFCHLNNSVSHGPLSLFHDRWGDRKISVHSIILMVNAKPNKEFQYVKIVGLAEICRYITYFKPVFNDKEVQQIVDCLR